MLAIVDSDCLLHWAARGSDDEHETEEKLHELIEESLGTTFASDSKFAVKGANNFRYGVFADYKANRGSLDPDLKRRLVAGHNILVADYGAVASTGMEADDLVRIWAEEARSEGESFVVIAEDKDLDCIAGAHYNPKKGRIYHVSEDDADLLYHQQLLTGDSADNIKGLWRIGPVKAKKWLADYEFGNRMEGVKAMWQEKHPEDWEERLMLCGSLIHILRSHDDKFTIDQ